MFLDALEILRLLVGLAIAGSLSSIGFLVVSDRLAETRLPLRVASGGIAAIGYAGLATYLFLATGTFGLIGPLIATSVAAGVGLWRWRTNPELRATLDEDLEALSAVHFSDLSPLTRLLVGITALFGGVHLLRHLVIPPLAWDSLLYHLPRAAEWAKGGPVAPFEFPGVLAYTNYYMPLGDALSAWAMAPTSSDLLVPVAWFGVWVGTCIAIYTLARQFDAPREHAMLGTLTAGLFPTLTGHMFVAAVDPLVAFAVLTATALLVDAARHRRSTSLGMAMLALGVALATKRIAVPFVAAQGVVFLYLLWRDHTGARLRPLAWGLFTFGLVSLPPVVYLFVSTGSPVYPSPLTIGGYTLFEGHSEYVWIAEAFPETTLSTYLERLVWTGYGSWLTHLNLGIYAPVLLAAGVYGAFRICAWRSDIRPVVVGFLTGGIVLTVIVFETIINTGLHMSRYFVALPCFLVAAAASLDHRAIRWLFGVGIGVHLVYFLPVGWSVPDVTATVTILVATLVTVAIGSVLYRLAGLDSKVARWSAALGAAIVAVAFASLTLQVRETWRYPVWKQANLGDSFANFPVTGNHAYSYSSARLWYHVDRPPESLTVAVTVGWDKRGMHWFIYPFYGSRLQNDVTYVPVTASGEPVPHRQKELRATNADYEAWRERLREREVDFVAALAPPSLEMKCLDTHSEDFTPVARGPGRYNRLYRVDFSETPSR